MAQRKLWVHPRDRHQDKKPPEEIIVFTNKHWQQCYSSWVVSMRSVRNAESTVKLHGGFIRRFFSDRAKTPDQYVQQDVLDFINAPCLVGANKNQPPSPATRNAKLNALISFYRFASLYDIPYRKKTRPIITTRAPTTGIKAAEKPIRPRALTDEEIHLFFAAIPLGDIVGRRDRALFLCLFWSGRRRREIARLTWASIKQDVLFEDGRIGVAYSWIGKRHVTQSTAELPPDAWEAVRQYLVADGRWGNMKPESPIFLAHDQAAQYRPEEPISGDAIGYAYHKYCERAGIGYHRGVHDFRWTQAQLTYRESGRDIMAVKEKLGHENIMASERYLIGVARKGDSIALRLRSKYGNL